MTRDQAIEVFNAAAKPSSFSTEAWIDRFVALGMLRLDQPVPSDGREALINAVAATMVGHDAPDIPAWLDVDSIIDRLGDAGFEIARKAVSA